jgi:hypothetical protein
MRNSELAARVVALRGEAYGRGCWGDRAVQLMPAGQVVYHGVPSPNPGRIIALST